VSNGRKPSAQAQDYRTGYLKSATWFGRRDQWIDTELGRVGQLTCACCQGNVDRKKVELHHLSYGGVGRTADGWTAGEAHEDLVGLHVRCHEWLHRLLDGDAALRRMSDRVLANRIAIARLRARLRRTVDELLGGV
jgi:5-methylcytosine-specific restriction protein A